MFWGRAEKARLVLFVPVNFRYLWLRAVCHKRSQKSESIKYRIKDDHFSNMYAVVTLDVIANRYVILK